MKTNALVRVHAGGRAQASLGGRKHAALLLVSRGAQVDAESAVQERHYTPLVQVALADRLDAMELLLDVGAKPDLELSCGSTALIECSAAGLVRPAQVLLRRGAAPNRETKGANPNPSRTRPIGQPQSRSDMSLCCPR